MTTPPMSSLSMATAAGCCACSVAGAINPSAAIPIAVMLVYLAVAKRLGAFDAL